MIIASFNTNGVGIIDEVRFFISNIAFCIKSNDASIYDMSNNAFFAMLNSISKGSLPTT